MKSIKVLLLVCGLAVQGTGLIAGPVFGKMVSDNFNEFGIEAALFTIVLYSLNYSPDKIDRHVDEIYLPRKKMKLEIGEMLPDRCHDTVYYGKFRFVDSFELTQEEQLQIQKSLLKPTGFSYSLTSLELQQINTMPELESRTLSWEDQAAVDSVNAWSRSINIYGKKKSIEDYQRDQGRQKLPPVRYSK